MGMMKASAVSIGGGGNCFVMGCERGFVSCLSLVRCAAHPWFAVLTRATAGFAASRKLIHASTLYIPLPFLGGSRVPCAPAHSRYLPGHPALPCQRLLVSLFKLLCHDATRR